jgi:dihydroorotase/N-acyl-D-amino-acid deacylase
MSTGRSYVPGSYSPTEVIVELATMVGKMGGLHTSHIRDETSRVLDSVRETIRIGEEGGLPTQITHHKIIGKDNWGQPTGEDMKLNPFVVALFSGVVLLCAGEVQANRRDSLATRNRRTS